MILQEGSLTPLKKPHWGERNKTKWTKTKQQQNKTERHEENRLVFSVFNFKVLVWDLKSPGCQHSVFKYANWGQI